MGQWADSPFLPQVEISLWHCQIPKEFLIFVSLFRPSLSTLRNIIWIWSLPLLQLIQDVGNLQIRPYSKCSPDICLLSQPHLSLTRPHPLKTCHWQFLPWSFSKTAPTGYLRPPYWCKTVISLLLSSLHQSNLEIPLLRLNLILLIWLNLVYCMGEKTHYCGFQNIYHRLLHSHT